MFHYGFMHAVLIDWAAGRDRAPSYANKLVDTVSVLDGGKLPVEERLHLVELGVESAAETGIRTAPLTDEVIALGTLAKFGLLSTGQRERLRRAEREMYKSVEV